MTHRAQLSVRFLVLRDTLVSYGLIRNEYRAKSGNLRYNCRTLEAIEVRTPQHCPRPDLCELLTILRKGSPILGRQSNPITFDDLRLR